MASAGDSLALLLANGPVHLTGVFAHGGLGDLLRALAFCSRVPVPDGGAVALLFNSIGLDADGRELVEAIISPSHKVRCWIRVELQDPRKVVARMAHVFDVFYEIQAGPVRSWYWKDVQGQHQADLRLRPYLAPATMCPQMNGMLPVFERSVWEMMAETSGVDVRPFDMSAPCSEPPDCIPQTKYVAITSGVGGAAIGRPALTKAVPVPVLSDIAAVLAERDYAVVQVGCCGDPEVANTVDVRGCNIAGTAAILRDADLLVSPEGGLVYLAKAVGTRSAVLYGSTPEVLFHMPGNIALSERQCEPCWWKTADWSYRCPKGHAYCLNIPKDGRAAGQEIISKLGDKSEVLPQCQC